MSQIPTSIAPLLSSIAPNPIPETSTENKVKGIQPLAISSNQLQRNKMQNVPAFLNKLYNMVDDHTTDDLIRWSEDGLSFNVVRHEEFAKKVLPRFFKHSNFSSFVRQLNMYGFHKVPHLQNGVLGASGETERWEFNNPHFQRNQPDLLLLVTRKKGRDPEEKETGAVDLHHIMDEIAAIKKHQMSISNELKNVQSDNQILWQENIATKERHNRHQETIDKILRFLASVFSSDKNKQVVIPRKRQFLLEGTKEDNKSKKPTNKRKHSRIEDVEEEENDVLQPKYARTDPPSFDITEFVNDAPVSSTTPATADLAAAIALNDQTKKDAAASLVTVPKLNTTVTTPDFSSLINLPQFQGLVALAQTNPALFNQLTNSSYFDIPAEPQSAPSSAPETPLLTPSTAADLEISLKSLASELGFETNPNTQLDDMDELLNTYTQQSPTDSSSI